MSQEYDILANVRKMRTGTKAIPATRRAGWLQVAGIRFTLLDMPTQMQRIANRVRGIAAEHRYTQQRLAATLGVSRTSVVERINGRVPFTAVEILRLAEVMNVPVAEFFPQTPAVRNDREAVAA